MNLSPLIEGIKQLEERYDIGELAYLCLNGKSENHLRDLISFNISRKHPSWNVQREVDRVDLRIKNTKGYQLNVEFKVGYAGAVISRKEKSQVIKGALEDKKKRS